MAAKLKGKLSGHRRTLLTTTAPDFGDLGGCLFLKSQGFVATGVRRDGSGDGVDAIEFVWRHEWGGEDS